MAEMFVTAPPTKRTVHDYDVVFESGMGIPLTIDADSGDTINFTDNQIRVHLVAKPSNNDPTQILPAEDTTIFLTHVISITHRVREITDLSPEEKLEWKKTWDTMISNNSTVQ